MQTIGVVLEVPEPWGSQIQAYREQIGDPMADLIGPHITVLPPVGLAADMVDEVVDHLIAAASSVEPFEIHLAGTQSFRPLSPVVFLEVAEGAEGCESLERKVRTGPLGIDLAWPYHPHVTLAHRLPGPVLDAAAAQFADFEARFAVDALTLYLLDPDGDFRPTHAFGLGSRGGPGAGSGAAREFDGDRGSGGLASSGTARGADGDR